MFLLEITQFSDPDDIIFYTGGQLKDIWLCLKPGRQVLQHLVPQAAVQFITDDQQCPFFAGESVNERTDDFRFRLRLADDGPTLPARTLVDDARYLAIETVLPLSADFISAKATASASRASAGVTTVGVVSFSMHSRKYSISLW